MAAVPKDLSAMGEITTKDIFFGGNLNVGNVTGSPNDIGEFSVCLSDQGESTNQDIFKVKMQETIIKATDTSSANEKINIKVNYNDVHIGPGNNHKTNLKITEVI